MSIKLVENYDKAMSETWLPVPGYEDRYEISEVGVRSLRTGRLLSPQRIGGTSGSRYVGYSLYREDGYHTDTFHSLLAKTFIGPRPEGMYVLHRDDNPDNNSLENLYYGTPSENNFDQVRNGLHPKTKRKNCPRGHPLVLPNLVGYRLEKLGQRTCLSCRTAKNILRHRNYLDLQEVSDACYEEIVNGQDNPYRRTISQGLREGRYGN
jgi:hypothetical protein